jgi:hypothetical protein
MYMGGEWGTITKYSMTRAPKIGAKGADALSITLMLKLHFVTPNI